MDQTATYVLVLFDHDGCTLTTTPRCLAGGPELLKIASRTTMMYKGKQHEVEILQISDSFESLDTFEDKWSDSHRSTELTKEKKRRSTRKLGNKYGGFLDVWPTDPEGTAEETPDTSTATTRRPKPKTTTKRVTEKQGSKSKVSTAADTTLPKQTHKEEAISATIENDILDKIARSPFISLLTDESTDISNSKKMVVYIRSFDSDTFVASTNFLGNIEIQESSTTAEVLFHHLTKFLHDKNIPMDKIIGFGSDGASVMTGSKSGVATRFREKCPHLVNIHCMAHRFNLCTSQASKNITYLKDIFEKTFKDLYYYFDKSGNRVAELKEIQQVLDGPTLKIKQVHEIRWLAFYDALYAVFHSWEALVKYFKKQNKTKTQLELYQAITDYRFVVFMHIMMDIIPNLAEMSMLLQKENLDISVVMPQLDNINRVLDNVDRSCTSTYYQRMLSENLDTSGQKPKFKKVQLYIHRSTTAKTVSDIQTDKKAFIAALKCQLNARFPPASKSISKAFAVLGLRNLSHLSSDDIDAYGEKEIEQLCDYYGQTKTVNDVSSPAKIRPVALPVQWKLAKTVILREKYPRDRMPSLWKDVHDFHADSFPDLLTLASIALVMPYQTADCERGFSKQNLTKSPSRNRLGEQAMNRLLMISIEGPPIREFNFNRALCVYKRGNRKASYLKK